MRLYTVLFKAGIIFSLFAASFLVHRIFNQFSNTIIFIFLQRYFLSDKCRNLLLETLLKSSFIKVKCIKNMKYDYLTNYRKKLNKNVNIPKTNFGSVMIFYELFKVFI